MKSLSWTSHPAKERPVAAAVVFVIMLVVFYYVYHATRSPIMVLVAILVFLISLSTFFFPTRYTVDEKMVVIKYLYNSKERNISAFRTLFPGRRGVLLSPFLGPSRIENFRGFYLRYGKYNKEQVDSFLADLFLEKPPSERVKNNAGGTDGA